MTIGTFPSDDQMASASPSKDAPDNPSSLLSDFGLSIAPSDDKSGVVVSDVDPNGQAAEVGLQPGDVILAVGDSEVATPADVESKVAAAKADGLKAVRLRVKSGRLHPVRRPDLRHHLNPCERRRYSIVAPRLSPTRTAGR